MAFGQRVAGCGRDRRRLRHDRLGEARPAGRCGHLADRSVHQRVDRAEADDEGPLRPHRADDVVDRLGLETDAAQRLGRRLHPRIRAAAPCPEGQLADVREAHHIAVRVQLGHHQCDPAEYAALAEPLDQQVDLAHAVEDRDDQRVGADGRRHVVDRPGQSGLLDRQQDEVVLLLQFGRGDHRRLDEGLFAEADDPQPALPQRRRALLPDQESDVPSGLRQPAAEVAAGRARANNQNLHNKPRSSGCTRTSTSEPGSGRSYSG